MSTSTDGGPAFPFPSGPEPRVDQFHERSEGMTLRDYFAGQAMAGLSHPECIKVSDAETIAASAYEIADAMLKAREAKQ